MNRPIVPPEHSVILLGAGASSPAGGPLMREFIDRARGYEKQGLFTPLELGDIQAALRFYDCLRRGGFSITEEDIDNVENLLSLSELSRLIEHPPLEPLFDRQLPDRLRRFIDAVIAKSMRMPEPSSPRWLEWHDRTGLEVYMWLIAALAYAEGRITVITVNYDCLVEYICYCMGLPYTYNRAWGDGLELLKLHGSINWVQCSKCEDKGSLRVSPIEHHQHKLYPKVCYIERSETICTKCEAELTPLIVPPTWQKEMDHEVLRKTWSRAAGALLDAEVLVVVGYSLPIADSHVRELLHVGLSSANLQRSLIVVASDEESAQRWSDLFRPSYRQRRVEIYRQTFQDSIRRIVEVLGFDDRLAGSFRCFPPIEKWMRNDREMLERLREPMLKLHAMIQDPVSVNWRGAEEEARGGPPWAYTNVWIEAGLHWVPPLPNLPVHGHKLGSSE